MSEADVFGALAGGVIGAIQGSQNCSAEKKDNCYVFSKHHNGQKEVYLDSYLKRFMVSNLDLNKIINN